MPLVTNSPSNGRYQNIPYEIFLSTTEHEKPEGQTKYQNRIEDKGLAISQRSVSSGLPVATASHQYSIRCGNFRTQIDKKVQDSRKEAWKTYHLNTVIS